MYSLLRLLQLALGIVQLFLGRCTPMTSLVQRAVTCFGIGILFSENPPGIEGGGCKFSFISEFEFDFALGTILRISSGLIKFYASYRGWGDIITTLLNVSQRGIQA